MQQANNPQPHQSARTGTYAAAAQQNPTARTAQTAVQAQGPYEHLRDRRLVGHGNGSALAAAMKGGRQSDRLIARLNTSAEERLKDSIELMDTVNGALAASGAPDHVRVDVVSPCPTGFTIIPKRGCTIEQLAGHKQTISSCLNAAEVEEDEEWHKLVIHGVQTHTGSGEIDEEYLASRLAENEKVGKSLRGKVQRLCAKDQDWTTKESTPVAFFVKANSGLAEGDTLRLLGRVFRVVRFRPHPDTMMCGSCKSYRHKTPECRQGPRCARCAQTGHTEAEHEQHCSRCKSGTECVPLCMHCRGPHRAGDTSCRNRPTWDRFARGYTLAGGNQLNRINANGDRLRNKAIRAQEGPATGANAAPLGDMHQAPPAAI
ncbi:hypothetical protein V8E36_006035 [Tilletia maclaganii]